MGPDDDDLKQKFLRKVMKKTDGSNCWIWLSQRQTFAYGRRGNIKATHFAWLAWRGELPENSIIRRSCRHPICVNPEHLELERNSSGDHYILRS